ncbi:MAG: Hsp70 family protein, partial [Candidatus Melainabacteria bacterium]|nr:Hsp70 family protein [Candidatus Melainabacteria bacterium]
LLDVIPLSLGIETAGGLFTRIIERNTTIPTSRTMTFTTTENGQTSVEVHVLQGERELANANKSLAKYHLAGIPAAPRSVPKIEVTFDIDADGIVHCSARDYGSGIKHSITIQRSTGLSPDEVESYQKEAEEFAEHDKAVKDEVTAKIRAEGLVAESKRTVEKYGERVEKNFVEKVSRASELVVEALEKGHPDEIKSATAGLDVALMELGSAIHSGNRGGTPSAKKRPLTSESGPIELGEVARQKLETTVNPE